MSIGGDARVSVRYIHTPKLPEANHIVLRDGGWHSFPCKIDISNRGSVAPGVRDRLSASLRN